MKFFTCLLPLFISCAMSMGQTNCTQFTDSSCARACRLYREADRFGQGSRMSQLYFDSALRLCPGYAEAWREISVPYLKRGDFLNWRRYIDQAVLLKPRYFLGIRGWCRFKFLKDYEGALEDLKRFDTITSFNPGQSGDGNYHLYIVMALCERELGHYDSALSWFAKGIDSIILHKGADWLGLYDYMHRAVTKIRIKDYAGALSDLDKQIARYEKYADPWYYKAMVLIKTMRLPEAAVALEKARLLYTTNGYRITDPYCEMMDAVYLSDIEEALVICR